MMDIVLRGAIYRYEYGSNFVLDVSQAEYEADPNARHKVPDNPFWRMQASWPDRKRQYDIVYEVKKKEEKVIEPVIEKEPEPEVKV